MTTDQKVRGSNPLGRAQDKHIIYAQNLLLLQIMFTKGSHGISHTCSILVVAKLKIINIMLFNLARNKYSHPRMNELPKMDFGDLFNLVEKMLLTVKQVAANYTFLEAVFIDF